MWPHTPSIVRPDPTKAAGIVWRRDFTEDLIAYDVGMRARLGLFALAWAALSGCDQPVSPTVTTGLKGVVVRGPITPVCQIQTSCDAPFSAAFSVDQNSRRITEFRSDAAGRFAVIL